MSASGMTIGRLALSAGVRAETIRYYQRLGLMPLPTWAYGTIRRYGPKDLKRMRFIKRAQKLGFSLEEIALLLGLAIGEHCVETKSLAEKKIQRTARHAFKFRPVSTFSTRRRRVQGALSRQMGLQTSCSVYPEAAQQSDFRGITQVSERGIPGSGRAQRAEVVEGRLMSDHVHMCLSIPPKIAVANVVGYMKVAGLSKLEDGTHCDEARVLAEQKFFDERQSSPIYNAW